MDPTDAMDNERESRSSVRAQNGPSFQLRAEHARDVSMDFPTDDYVPIMPEPEDPSPTWETFPFVAKKFTPVMFWSWDVHSENCAICRVMLMEPCLQCQVNNRTSCVVVWGECNHSFHNCCMAAWIKNPGSTNASSMNKCPLCQAEWIIQRVGN